MTDLDHDDWKRDHVAQMRLVPMVSHDTWTPARLAQWEAMSADDRGKEFDARLAAGHRLSPVYPNTDRPTTAVELRERFAEGSHAFDCFEASAPIWPMLVGPSGASTPSVPKATTPTPIVKAAAPVVPVVPVAAPVVAAPPAPKPSIDVGALWQRRREAQSGQTTAPTPRPGGETGTAGDQGKPGTGTARLDPSAIYTARRQAQG